MKQLNTKTHASLSNPTPQLKPTGIRILTKISFPPYSIPDKPKSIHFRILQSQNPQQHQNGSISIYPYKGIKQLFMLIFPLATLTFTLLAYLDIHGDPSTIPIFRLAVAAYSLLMIAHEMQYLPDCKREKQPQNTNYAVSLGYLTLLLSSLLNHSFIEGNLYLSGIFLITISLLCRVLNQVLSRKRGQKYYSNSFLELISMAGVGLCLFIDISMRADFEYNHHYNWIQTVQITSVSLSVLLHISAAYFNRQELTSGCQLYSRYSQGHINNFSYI